MRMLNPVGQVQRLVSRLRLLCQVPLRHCTFWRLFIVFPLFVILHNEFLVYWIYRLSWSPVYLTDSDENAVRMLFVADPQLVGQQDEGNRIGWLKLISEYDADTYLSKTFSHAFAYMEPDVVIYLGDLLDEGSMSPATQYKYDFGRFQQVFSPASNVKNIYVPGDNDVGGEGLDSVAEWKVNRFHEHFESKDVEQVKFIDFLRMHYGSMETFDGKVGHQVEALIAKSTGKYRFIVNHAPLMERPRYDFQHIIYKTGVNIIFTGHTHLAVLYTCLDCRDDLEKQGPRHTKGWEGAHKVMRDRTVYKFNVRDMVANRGTNV